MGRHIVSSDFPNTTTLYIWHFKETSDGGTIPNEFGGKDLTRVGNLTQVNNHLGENVYCEFDGTNDYASSTDAVFNFTGDFSVGGWFYAPSWILSKGMITRLQSGAINGWEFVTLPSAGGQINFSGFSTVRTFNHQYISTPSAGWHHVAATRDSGTESKIYLGGQLVSTDPDTSDTITAAGTFCVGASESGGSKRWTGRGQDVFVHNGTILTQPQIESLYDIGVAAAENRGGLAMFDLV